MVPSQVLPFLQTRFFNVKSFTKVIKKVVKVQVMEKKTKGSFSLRLK